MTESWARPLVEDPIDDLPDLVARDRVQEITRGLLGVGMMHGDEYSVSVPRSQRLYSEKVYALPVFTSYFTIAMVSCAK